MEARKFRGILYKISVQTNHTPRPTPRVEMSPTLAPSERSGGDAEAEPPDLSPSAIPRHQNPTTATTTARRSTGPSPAPQATPRLEARRGRGALRSFGGSSGRPGERLQEQLLLDFHTTAVPGSIAPSPHTALFWVTPALLHARYNLAFVRNMLNYTITVSPSRLEVTRVGPWVFRVRVANRNFANAIVVRGRLCMGSSVLLTHSSMATAVAGRRVPPELATTPRLRLQLLRSQPPLTCVLLPRKNF